MSDVLNPYVAYYLASVVAIYIVVECVRSVRRTRLQARRAEALKSEGRQVDQPEEVLIGPGLLLSRLRWSSGVDAIILGIIIIVLPILWYHVAGEKDGDAFLLAFAAFIVWVLITATEAGKAFFGGLLFRLLVAARKPFQIGDKVTLAGQSGKVIEIGLFHVRLQTFDDDLVSLPTAKLWSETLISANAGDRASLVSISVHLSPRICAERLQKAEDELWDAIGGSLYWDPTKPRQIYFNQSVEAVTLTGKAYVASTYNEPLFRSEVLKRFLMWAREEQVPLAEKL